MQPPIFNVFNLPAGERLAALRAALDTGADPNSVDATARRWETLLGRAFSIGKGAVDMEIVQELLDRGANPLRGQMWCEEVGKMEPLFNRIAFMTKANTAPLPSVLSADMVQANPMHAFLKACLNHGHTDEEGNDAMSHMVQKLRTYSHAQFAEPIRYALAIGFPVNQPIENNANAVHHLLTKYMLTTVQAGMAPAFNEAWDFISDFVDAGIDMSKQNARGFTAWEVIDQLAKTARHIQAYAKIQSTRQHIDLNKQTPSISISRRSSRL